ncbi:MAG TPA: hypothetical protein VFK80_04240 [Limnochordia bacterium]|nr:hypothetical protein [Limnochordia bacterium]
MAHSKPRFFGRHELGWYAAVTASTLALQRGFVHQIGPELIVLMALAGVAHLVYRNQQSAARTIARSPRRTENKSGALTMVSAAFFATLAVLLQSAPAWMAEGGPFVALAAVAPVFFAFRRDREMGVMAAFAGAALLSTISLGATAIFLLTTVPLGAGLAWTFEDGVNSREALYQVAGALFAGMLLLNYVSDIPALYGWAKSQGTIQALLIYACTAFLYTLAWATALTQLSDSKPETQPSNLRRIA